MSGDYGKAFHHPDPAINEAFQQIYQAIQLSGLGPDQVDLEAMKKRLGKETERAEFRELFELVVGKKAFRRLFGSRVKSSGPAGVEFLDVSGGTDYQRLKVVRAPSASSTPAGPGDTMVFFYIEGSTKTACEIRADQDSRCLYLEQDGLTSGAGLPLLQLFRTNTGDAANYISTNAGSGSRLTAAGVWDDPSSEALKENFEALEDDETLAGIQDLRVLRYNHKRDRSRRRIGPMAEDIHKAFGVSDGHGLSGIDVGGIALRSCQALVRRVESLESRLEAAENRIRELEGA